MKKARRESLIYGIGSIAGIVALTQCMDWIPCMDLRSATLFMNTWLIYIGVTNKLMQMLSDAEKEE